MNWLHLLVAHPGALASFMAWLRERETLCTSSALDVDLEAIPALKGKRDAFREIIGYINNNHTLVQRGLNASTDGASSSNKRT